MGILFVYLERKTKILESDFSPGLLIVLGVCFKSLLAHSKYFKFRCKNAIIPCVLKYVCWAID